MSDSSMAAVVRPPQQRRSREALARVLQAAEDVLTEHGIEGLTITAVAERAETSVGGIYRRFAGKEQLLAAIKIRLVSSLEERLDTELAQPGLDLKSALAIYVRAITEAFSHQHGLALGELLRGSNPDLDQIGADAIESFARRFDAGVAVYRSEVAHPDPDAALAAVRSTIISASIHRGVAARSLGEQLDPETYAEHLAAMTYYHLVRPNSPVTA